MQNRAHYLLRVTFCGKIVRNFKILDHIFQNQVRSHNVGPSNIQNLPKYLSLQIKLALLVGGTKILEEQLYSSFRGCHATSSLKSVVFTRKVA